jgi:hypothetical protein
LILKARLLALGPATWSRKLVVAFQLKTQGLRKQLLLQSLANPIGAEKEADYRERRADRAANPARLEDAGVVPTAPHRLQVFFLQILRSFPSART